MTAPRSNKMASQLALGTAVARPHNVSSVAIEMPVVMSAAAMEARYGDVLQGPVRPSMWRLIELAGSQPNPFTYAWCIGVSLAEPEPVQPPPPARRRSRWSLLRM